MNSFTSSFRYFLPLLAALALIVAIECAIARFGPAYDPIISSQLLHRAYYKPLLDGRLLTLLKLENMEAQPVDIIQIGDSSGMVGVKPELVEKYLKGLRYINASQTMSAEFSGIRITGDQLLIKHPEARALVLVLSYGMLLADDYKEFGDDIVTYYETTRGMLWSRLPSQSYRSLITNVAYYRVWDPAAVVGRNYHIGDSIKAEIQELRKNGGWRAFPVSRNLPPHMCKLNPDAFQRARDRLDSIYRVAQQHRVKFAIVIGPVQCQADDTTKQYNDMMAEYAKARPDILFPMGTGLTHIAPKYMADSVHTMPEGAEFYSRMYGKALAKALKQAGLFNSAGSKPSSLSSPGH